MTANVNPLFVLTPNTGFARVTAANLAADGSGSLSDLFSAGSNGSLIWRLRWFNSQASAAASSNMVIRFFLTDSGGANPRLIYEVALAGATRSTTAVGAFGTLTWPGTGLFIASGQHLKVVQSVYAGVQDQMDFIAEGGDY